MKKTLMVLSFALCAGFAFAQSNSVSLDRATAVTPDMARQNNYVEQPSAGYTGSIFTKDDEDVFTCTFSSDDVNSKFTKGTVGTGEEVNGLPIPRHTNAGDYGVWQRIPNRQFTTNTTFTNRYPAMMGQLLDANDFVDYIESTTPDDGFMLMSMIDNYSGWGGDGDEGVFDAWIRFQTLDLTDYPLVRASFYQWYICFNADKNYIDYSINNGSTWNTLEINVRNVDLRSNTATRGWKRVTLPRAIGGQATVSIRIRWADEGTDEMRANGTAGGYFWAIDDFVLTAAPQYHFNVTDNRYFEGFYQMMPKGLQVPVVWASNFTNDGVNDHQNSVGKLYSMAANEDATVLMQRNLGTVVARDDSNRAFVIDPLGFYDSASASHGFTYDFDSSYNTGASTYVCLPTDENGAYYFFSDINSSYYTNHIGDSVTFDTIRYNVNYSNFTDAANNQRPAGYWSRGHNVLTYNGNSTNGNHYTPGLVPSQGAWSEDFTETLWNKSGYGTMISYVTGNNVPAGWRILGMEMVASTTPGMQGAGAQIIPILWRDSATSTGVSFVSTGHGLGENGTGASVYTIKESDVHSEEDLEGMTYTTNYKTIRVLFPNQPLLDPRTVYRLGYVLNEDADFAVATARNRFVRNDTNFHFSSESALQSYSSILTSAAGNGYNVITRDPRRTQADGTITFYPTTYFPMIRMIVGPAYHINKFAVKWECDDEEMGGFYDGNNESLCGITDSVAENYPVSAYIVPEAGYEIDRVMNGEEEIEFELVEDPDGSQYGIIEIESVTEPMTLKCYFKRSTQGFDPIANNVSMKLQPNPATNNVFISLKGVTGNVNMSLIDMSGRVVTTSQFTAENGANINVSNLAKGAYFVRITNNNFTKIEKLIVR